MGKQRVEYFFSGWVVGVAEQRRRGDIRLPTCGHLSDVIHAYAFMNLIPGGTYKFAESPTCMDDHIHADTKKRNFQPCTSKAGALQSWHLDSICEHTGRCQKALMAGF